MKRMTVRGYEIMLDDEDYAFFKALEADGVHFNSISWGQSVAGPVFLFMKDGKRILFHRHIMGAKEDNFVFFKVRNSLNLQKSNLMMTSGRLGKKRSKS